MCLWADGGWGPGTDRSLRQRRFAQHVVFMMELIVGPSWRIPSFESNF